MIAVREKPPLRWSVRVTDPDGRPTRWARDESSVENVPTGSTCSDSMPGGFETFQSTLLRKTELDYGDTARLADVAVEGVGGWPIWLGRNQQAPRNTDDRSYKPEAVGYQNALEDFKGAAEIYRDIDYSHWEAPSDSRRLAIAQAGQGQESHDVTVDPVTGVPRINTKVVGPWGQLQVCEVYYDAGPLCKAGTPYYAFLSGPQINPGGLGDANWQWSVNSCDDTSRNGAGASSGNLRAASGSGTLTANKRVIYLQHFYAVAAGTGGFNYNIGWTVAIYGTHGLTKQGIEPNAGLLASDVIANAISRWAPGLDFTTGVKGSIQPSSFVIPHLEFREATTAAEIVKAANRFELNDWAVWDGQFGPTFYYNPRGARGRAWKARVAPAHLEAAGPSMDRLWNGMFVSYQGVDGSYRIVGPTGTSADATSASLLDTDPLNPANKLGIPRYGLLEMQEVSTPAASIEVGRRFLVGTKELDQSGKATITGYVTDDKNIVHPYHHIRAGDTIAFVDAADPSPRRIVHTEKDLDNHTCSLDLDAPPEGLQALLEQLSVVLVP